MARLLLVPFLLGCLSAAAVSEQDSLSICGYILHYGRIHKNEVAHDNAIGFFRKHGNGVIPAKRLDNLIGSLESKTPGTMLAFRGSEEIQHFLQLVSMRSDDRLHPDDNVPAARNPLSETLLKAFGIEPSRTNRAANSHTNAIRDDLRDGTYSGPYAIRYVDARGRIYIEALYAATSSEHSRVLMAYIYP